MGGGAEPAAPSSGAPPVAWRANGADFGLAVAGDDGGDGVGKDQARMVANVVGDRMHGAEPRRLNPHAQDLEK
jgi:hypothetical protein